jgi:drug/metabolite transporter (DMT)-like permease
MAPTAAVTSATSNTQHGRGVALCLLSAVGFGLMAIFAKEAYRNGVSVTTLLALRFAIAACAFWAIVAARRPLSIPARGALVSGLALGAVGYAGEAGAFFAALTRLDASLTSLLLYTYPAIVFAAAVALRRERADRRRISALALATGGAALVLVGGGTGALDPLGVALALGAAVSYSAYVLLADRVLERLDPFVLSALISTGAATSFAAVGAASGSLDLHLAPAAWAWIGALAVVSTVVAISAFLVGLPKVGPATASIVSTIEPVVTVGLAMAFFGERLAGVQVAGGALVLIAVILLAAKVRLRGPSSQAPAPAPARALASQPAGG